MSASHGGSGVVAVEGPAVPLTVASMIRHRSTLSPTVAAVIIGDEEVSYGELFDRASSLSAALAAAGVETGDRVATLAPSCREVLETLVAASIIGAVFVPLNFRYGAHELRQVLADSRPAFLLVDDDPTLESNRFDLLKVVAGDWSTNGATAAGSVARDSFGIRKIVRVTAAARASGPDSYGEFVEPHDPASTTWVNAERNGPAAIIYTSGTSAEPKGVHVPEAALTVRQAAIAERLGLRMGDHIHSPLPLFHIAGYIPFLSAVSAGATYVTNRYFDAAAACALIDRHRCRVAWTGFDTILRSIIEASEAGAGSLQSLEVDALIGPPPALQELESRLSDCRLLLIYGSTELGSAATLPSPADDLTARTETSGRELTGTTIEILGSDGTTLSPGEKGEICGRGDAVTLGYHRTDGAPDRSGFDADGWFHSGDLGLRRADGQIQYLSRLKDLIKVRGENVSGAEIESFLVRHPKVREVQVVGVPDDDYGEVPVAFVEWAPGTEGDAGELDEYCRAELSRVRIPREFVFLSEHEWPRSATKIRKSDLREMYMAQRTSTSEASSKDRSES